MTFNRTFIIAGLVATTSFTPATAQKKDGGITSEMLQEIRLSRKQTTAGQALFNALAANSIDNLAKNHANQGALNTYFSVETKQQSITDQQSSGRCWMFSGFNVLRSAFADRTDSLTVELSQDFLFFYDQLEKANLFLQGIIDCAEKPVDDARVQFFFKSPIGDGGTFCGVADLVDKYGLVPKEVMPETYSSNNTSKATSLIKSKLREFGLKLRAMTTEGKKTTELKKEKTAMLSTIYNMLTMVYGVPPSQFDYAFTAKNGRAMTTPKNYTPLTFAKEIL